eukprot:gene3777-4301_t
MATCNGHLLFNLTNRANNVNKDLVEFSAIFPSLICTTITFGAVLGNSIMLYIIYKCKMYKTTQNILLVNMAVTDLLNGLVVMPANIVLRILELLHEYNCFLDVFIKVCAHVLSGVAGLTIGLIAVYRCIKVVYPLTSKTWPLKCIFKLALAFVWPYTILLVSFYTSQVVEIEILKKILIFNIVIVIVLLAFCYMVIFSRLKAREQNLSNIGVNFSTSSQGKAKRKSNTYALISLIFIMMFAPRVAVLTVKDSEIRYHLLRWTAMLIFANSALNPFIYFYRRDLFKEEIVRRLRGRGNGNSIYPANH